MTDLLARYWTGKCVLITGASSGLGRAVTQALAKYGIKFCLLSRRERPMLELAEELKDSGSSFRVRACDVRDREQVHSLVREFYTETGHLDVGWVNSGISLDSSYANWSWQDFENLIDTNLKGAVYTTQACLQLMTPKKKGTIVGIGSAASMRGLPSRGVYSLTKVGLEYYFQSLSAELTNIQFTLIHPGFVDTPINQNNPNRFWLLTPEKAAQLMIKAVAKRRQMLVYPFKMNLLFHCVRLLPLPVYHWLARRTMKLSRPTEPPKMTVSPSD